MERYGIVSAALMANNGLSFEARGLYAILATYCNRDRSCFPSTDTLVSITGRSKATIFRWLKELEDKGVINKIQEGRRRIVTLNDNVFKNEH